MQGIQEYSDWPVTGGYHDGAGMLSPAEETAAQMLK